MGWIENLLLAVALAADAFAVSIVRGMTGRGRHGDAVMTALCFACAQTAMPVIGYLLGVGVAGPLVHRGGHLLAGGILLLLGLKMLLDRTREGEPPIFCTREIGLYMRVLGAQAAATAIDALAVGISLCASDTPLWPTAAVIGWVTGLLCYIGYHLGRNLLDSSLGAHAQGVGGAVLIGMAFHTLLGG